MIIKFKSKDTWVIFGEIDHVEYSYMGQQDEVSPKAIVFDPAEDQAEPAIRVGIGFFTKNMTEATQVVAFSPIYLMNDNGKTIETI